MMRGDDAMALPDVASKDNDDEDREVLRQRLVSCPGVSPGSSALAAALACLEHPNTDCDYSSSSAESPVPNEAATDVPHSAKNKQRSSSTRLSSHRCVGLTTRTLLLDLPLALLFLLYVSLSVLGRVDELYLGPMIKSMLFNDDIRSRTDTTYYRRECDPNDLSTRERDDLILLGTSNLTTAHDAAMHMMKHGMTVFPNMLKEETMKNLRDHILKRNAALNEKEEIYVIENRHRWSFRIGANEDPAVSAALQEIATHPVFRPAIEKIAGNDPAIIEMTAITAEYGAKTQNWHDDVVKVGAYSRAFAPSYALAIPLQDVTAEMGATSVCPGTHLCSPDDNDDFYYCDEYCFQMSGKQNLWKRGYGALYNQQTYHRGHGHTDPNRGHRVVIFVTFTHRPLARGETRMLAPEGTYSMKWDLNGHCISDLEDPPRNLAHPWAALRALGLYKPKGAHWGWDFVSLVSMHLGDGRLYFSLGNNLEQFLRDTIGFIPPKFLEPEMDDDVDWYEYEYLRGTLHNCIHWSLVSNMIAICVYLVMVVCLNGARRMLSRDKGRRSPLAGRALARLAVTHGSLFFLGQWFLHRTARTGWAKDIVSGHLYGSPYGSRIDSTLVLPQGPTAFPWRWDVLIGRRYDSEYMASYQSFLDFHFGNALWKDTVRESASAFDMYADSPHLRNGLIKSIVRDVVESSPGRFLLQNNNGDWIVLPKQKAEHYTRLELLMESRAGLKEVIKGIRYGLSECQYGIFRDTAMFRRHTVRLLKNLERRLFAAAEADKEDVGKRRPTSRIKYGPVTLASITFPKGKAQAPLLLSRMSSSNHEDFGEKVGEEPPEGAWLTEGYVVEAGNQLNYGSVVWCRATLSRAGSERVFDVVYDDGEESNGRSLGSLGPYRPFVFEQGEEAVARLPRGIANVRIVEAYEDEDAYDVLDLRRGGVFIGRLPGSSICRFDKRENEDGDEEHE